MHTDCRPALSWPFSLIVCPADWWPPSIPGSMNDGPTMFGTRRRTSRQSPSMWRSRTRTSSANKHEIWLPKHEWALAFSHFPEQLVRLSAFAVLATMINRGCICSCIRTRSHQQLISGLVSCLLSGRGTAAEWSQVRLLIMLWLPQPTLSTPRLTTPLPLSGITNHTMCAVSHISETLAVPTGPPSYTGRNLCVIFNTQTFFL